MSNSITEYKKPWQALEGAFAHGPTFESELRKELSPNHPLYGQAVVAVARYLGSDDVLFRLQGEPMRYAVVHFTHSGRAETWPSFPSTEFFDSFDEFAGKRLRPDSYGYEPSV
jgi:hypothetical protein